MPSYLRRTDASDFQLSYDCPVLASARGLKWSEWPDPG